MVDGLRAMTLGSTERESLIRAYVLAFALIAVSTEILSLFDAVTRTTIGLLWVTAAAGSLAATIRSLERDGAPRALGARLRSRLSTDAGELLPLVTVAAVLLATLVTALAYPPNNWDSMTYHMARVAGWIQRASVDFYPTSIERQNYQPPLAEFAILHLQLLSASDRFANMVQWVSFFVSIVIVTVIAKELGLSRRAQLFSAVVAATTPMAVLQSSSTQNDLVTAALCLSFAYFLARATRSLSRGDALFCGLSFGLALLSKGTADLSCAGIGLGLGAGALLQARSAPRLPLFGMLSAIVLAGPLFNAGHISRNVTFYGGAPTNASDIANERLSASVVASNAVRNVALHLGTPFESVNRYGFRAIHAVLGDHLNEPASTMLTTSFRVPTYSRHEDTAGNLLHVFLATLALIALPFVRLPRKAIAYRYAGAVLLSALIYCVILRWQPWASRLHTPVFMLSAPVVGAAVGGLGPLTRRITILATVVLGVYAVPFTLFNETRPFPGLPGIGAWTGDRRVESYFVNRRDVFDDYREAGRVIIDEGAEDVGLCLGYDDYEYPLWVLVGREASRGAPRLRHVGVPGSSETNEEEALPPPELVVETKVMAADPEAEAVAEELGYTYTQGRQAEGACLQGDYIVIFDSRHLRITRRQVS
jgi:hypothetical protein